MRIDISNFPHCAHHGLKNYTFDKEEGKFYNPKGEEVGGISNDGYYRFQTHSRTELTASGNRRTVYVPRSQVVYWLEHGLPADWVYQNKVIKGGLCVDHINRERWDDRLENLRLVDRSSNSLNRPICDRISDPEFRRTVAQCYNDGAGVPHVARRYKTDVTFVKKCVLEFGFKMRPAGRNKILAKYKQFIIDKRAEGQSDRKIAKVLGVTRSAIWQFRKRNGIK